MIFCVENVDSYSHDELTNIYNSMPSVRQARVDKMKMPKDRANSIVAWQLVKQGMERFGINADDYDYAVDDNGKPYLVDCPYYFSISHSDSVVVVSVCDTEVGVDVQTIVDDYEKIAKRICTPNEIALIKSKQDFLLVWTHKEATVKCTGEGISAMEKYDFSKDYESCFDYTFLNNEKYCVVECKKVG